MSSHTCPLGGSDAPSTLKPASPLGCGGKRDLSGVVLGEGGKHMSGQELCSPEETQEWRPKGSALSHLWSQLLLLGDPELCSQDAFSESCGLHR